MSDQEDPVEGAEIIDFGLVLKGIATEPLLHIKRRAGGCVACRFEFDQQERTVDCPKCKRKWEPFDALLHLAQHWDSYAGNRARLKGEVERLRVEAERLRKDVANLKAAKRRGDDAITSLLGALAKRKNAAPNVPRDRREWGIGFDAGVRAVIEFIKSDAWRSGGTL